jgi:hypothetical protein
MILHSTADSRNGRERGIYAASPLQRREIPDLATRLKNSTLEAA